MKCQKQKWLGVKNDFMRFKTLRLIVFSLFLFTAWSATLVIYNFERNVLVAGIVVVVSLLFIFIFFNTITFNYNFFINTLTYGT